MKECTAMEQDTAHTEVQAHLSSDLKLVLEANRANYLKALNIAQQLHMDPQPPQRDYTSKVEEINATKNLLRTMALYLLGKDMEQHVENRMQFEKSVSDERRREVEREYLDSAGFRGLLSTMAATQTGGSTLLNKFCYLLGVPMEDLATPDRINAVITHLQNELK